MNKKNLQKYIITALSIICASALFSSCESMQKKETKEKILEVAEFKNVVMTIEYQIVVGPIEEKQRKAIQEVIDATFQEINEVYNKWNPNSELSQLNTLQAYEKVKISDKLARFLERVDFFVRLSKGKFDPTVEPLQQLWKPYLANQNSDIEPSEHELEEIRPAIGWDKIVLKGNTFFKKHSKTALDLGGIAKGYAVDLLVERLKQKGIKNIFVEWGGEISAYGKHPEGRNWAVYIPNLNDNDPEHAIAYIPLLNQSIATSGDYQQYWEHGNTTYFHVYDTKTLRPLEVTEESIASATCLTSDCTTADALATMLLMCKNLEEAKELANNLQATFPNTSFWIMSRKELAN